jgi:hypothetical protein
LIRARIPSGEEASIAAKIEDAMLSDQPFLNGFSDCSNDVRAGLNEHHFCRFDEQQAG